MELKRFKKLLRENGNFVTVPRLRLFGVLQNHTTLTLKELITHIHKHDQATVYRNIELFEQLGIINRLRLGWHTKIELSDIFQHHHHHMSCVSCGKIFILKDNRTIENEISRIATKNGFKAIDHQLEIRGLCQKCLHVRKIN